MTKARFASLSIAITLAACGGTNPPPADSGPTALPGTYENVSTIFMASCAFASCHGGPGMGAANLNLQTAIMGGTLREELVDVPSCQYDLMPLVTAGDPDESWLMIKVAGAHTGPRIDFTPDPSWDEGGLVPDAMGRYPASTCPLVQSGSLTFGTIMPMGSANGLEPHRAETIRLWIEAGAPGPS